MSIQPSGGARQLSLFEQAIAGAKVVETVFSQKTVTSGDNKEGLVGVPFVITKVTFQLPDEELSKDNDVKDFVSLEAQIAPESYVQQNALSGWIPNIANVQGWIDSYGMRPDEYIVINDGSKGIRRQIVEALHNSGLIDIGERTGVPADFDRPWSDWEDFSQSEKRERDGIVSRVPSFTKGSHGDDLVMPVLRGLRKSKADDAPAAYSYTFYLS
jgi:hypothetical protein